LRKQEDLSFGMSLGASGHEKRKEANERNKSEEKKLCTATQWSKNKRAK